LKNSPRTTTGGFLFLSDFLRIFPRDYLLFKDNNLLLFFFLIFIAKILLNKTK